MDIGKAFSLRSLLLSIPSGAEVCSYFWAPRLFGHPAPWLQRHPEPATRLLFRAVGCSACFHHVPGYRGKPWGEPTLNILGPACWGLRSRRCPVPALRRYSHSHCAALCGCFGYASDSGTLASESHGEIPKPGGADRRLALQHFAGLTQSWAVLDPRPHLELSTRIPRACPPQAVCASHRIGGCCREGAHGQSLAAIFSSLLNPWDGPRSTSSHMMGPAMSVEMYVIGRGCVDLVRSSSVSRSRTSTQRAARDPDLVSQVCFWKLRVCSRCSPEVSFVISCQAWHIVGPC